MKPRHPTPEEKKLWRESNRGTVRARLEEDVAEEEVQVQHFSAPTALPMREDAPAKRSPAASLVPLSTREANRRFKQFPIDAMLDLHGATKLEARERVQQFLLRQHQAHRRHVVIITGKGKGGEVGVLRANLPDWLNEAPLRALISAYATARPEKGGTGVTHVLLKRP